MAVVPKKGILKVANQAFSGQAGQAQKQSIQSSLDSLESSFDTRVTEVASYSPAINTWVAPAPDTVSDAIDRLAAAVRSLLGVDIP